MLRAIAIDPGVTTGICIAEIHPEKWNNQVLGKPTAKLRLEQHTLSPYQLYQLLYELAPHHIITETFEFRRKTRDNLELESRDLIGVVRLYCEMSRADEDCGVWLGYPEGGMVGCTLHMQSAATGKGYFNDDTLKARNLYVAGKEHARDAERHMCHWLTFLYGYKFGAADNITIGDK